MYSYIVKLLANKKKNANIVLSCSVKIIFLYLDFLKVCFFLTFWSVYNCMLHESNPETGATMRLSCTEGTDGA